MKELWQVPTGSMGIGPLSAIHQARFLRYLQARGLSDTGGRHVWGVSGDGEMDDYDRAKFFDLDPESAALVRPVSDDNIHKLKSGGHDLKKCHAAFAAPEAHKGRPTVILAKTRKSYGMGGAGESRISAHQAKTLCRGADGLPRRV
ncbi:hypothetical protein [Pararhodobacter marinus]|uniref:hypothetical protein n=1 Tax=Pararhodobacter marinus TaxID=2184063 RepID=UPI001AF001FE|nr:hypothetical protein [Pararhodobacter marinus]